MTSDKLLDAIGMLDDDLILDARKGRQAVDIPWKQILAAAALVAVFSVAFAGKEAIIRTFHGIIKEPTTQDLYAGIDETEKKIGGLFDNEVKTAGDGFSEDEIKCFLEKNKYDIVGAIAAEYGEFDTTYKISTDGFYHVSLGETTTLLLDSITLPVFADNKIISCITLLKNGNKTVYSVTSKGLRIDNLNKAVSENKNGELAFFYVNGINEIAVSSENKIYLIGGTDNVNIDNQTDLFKNYATEKNTVSCKTFNSKSNCIAVTPLPEESVTVPDKSVSIDVPTETAAEIKAVNITLDDILAKKILSVEWNEGYNLLNGGSYRKCDESQKNDIIAYITSIDFAKSEESERKYGGAWYVKISFEDNSLATIVLIDETFYIETSAGQSAIYTDKSGNTLKLISYLAKL